MMKSLYSGVAGLKTHNQRMDVIGNNISNVNTTAFKASTVTFKDIFYQNKSRASSGSVLSGGTNANQVGYGAALSSIAQLMTQSGLVYSDRTTDCAIYGEGFFQVMDQAGNIYYTRNGSFHIDNYGNLCDAGGYIVLGVSGDPTGVAASSQRINLYVPPIDNKEASVTKTLNLKDGSYTFTASVASGVYGEEGNVSLTFVDSEVPFATQNGSSIVVYMKFDEAFGLRDGGDPSNPDDYDQQTAIDQFNQAVRAAMEAGGVASDILPITFDFDSIQPEFYATSASNTMTYKGEYDLDGDGEIGNDEVADLELVINSNPAYPGDYANSYEIDIVVNKTINADDPGAVARWDGNVLIISVSETGATEAQINAAIEKATGGDNRKLLTVEGGVSEKTAAILSKNNATPRVSLSGGSDNFFKTLVESIGTIKLTDGRRAAEQTTEDLEEIFIDDDGVIFGVHAVHGTIALGRIDIVLFENPEGLNQYGTSYWRESLSSGEAQVTMANDYGAGTIVSGALEMSNTDLAQEISDMIITQRGYQANTRVITVTDQMLEELVNLKR